MVATTAFGGCSGAWRTGVPDPVESPTAISASEWTPPDLGERVPPPEAIFLDPGDDFEAIHLSAPAGSTFVFRSGRHRGIEIRPRSGDSFIGLEGAVLDGEGRLRFAIVGLDPDDPVDDVLVSGLTIENYATPAQQGTIGGGGTRRWRVEGNEIRDNAGAGVELGASMLVLGNHIHHNDQIGVHAGFPVGDAIVEGNEIAFNNHQDTYDMAWEAGGAKFVKTTNLTVSGNLVHNNHGPGLWTDGSNTGTVYDGNVVVDNYGPGIFHEISYAASIRNNRVEGNAHRFYLGGILIANSPDVEVYGNRVVGNNGGIVGIQDERGDGAQGSFDLQNLWVHDNEISYSTGITGVRLNSASSEVYDSWNNRFDRNTYQLGSLARPFYWDNEELSRDEWRRFGHDRRATWR